MVRASGFCLADEAPPKELFPSHNCFRESWKGGKATETKDRRSKHCESYWAILIKEDKEQLDRIEEKLDILLKTHTKYYN